MTDSPIASIVDIAGIVRRAGGAASIAAASAGAVTADAVYKWRRIGIPDRHWPLLMSLSGVTADELVRANRAARGAPAGCP
jgi:hypothetical protein